MTKVADMTALFKDVLDDIDDAQQYRDWDPPNGNYDCQLMKYAKGDSEFEGTTYPWYKLHFKILSADGLDRDLLTRYFSTASRPGRGFAMTELLSIGRLIKGGPVKDFTELEKILKGAGDKQDRILNVSVRHEYVKKQNREYARYEWSDAETE
jgi:hypothetical protein